MRIGRRDCSAERANQINADTAKAAFAKGIDGRVCGENCILTCPKCGTESCRCMCSAGCPESPQALSSDPEIPIEPAIVPLVFEMKRLGIFWPCWSCEGHLRPDGTLWKVPRVWFYCDSMVHVRLLNDGLMEMENGGKLHVPWQIVLTYSDAENPETTFSLEPALSPGVQHDLPALQKDAAEIAALLEAMIFAMARKLQRNAVKPPPGDS